MNDIDKDISFNVNIKGEDKFLVFTPTNETNSYRKIYKSKQYLKIIIDYDLNRDLILKGVWFFMYKGNRYMKAVGNSYPETEPHCYDPEYPFREKYHNPVTNKELLKALIEDYLDCLINIFKGEAK